MLSTLSPHGQTRSEGKSAIDTLLIGTIDGVYSIHRGEGQSEWQAQPRGLQGKHVSSLLHDSDLLLAGVHGTSGGLYSSSDMGETWQQRTDGLPTPHVYMLASERRGDRTLFYAGTEPARLYRSEDGGRSWSELESMTQVPGTDQWTFPSPPHIAHVKTMSCVPGREGSFYVLIEQGALLKTDDDGETWQEVASYASNEDSFYKDVHRLAIRPSDPRQMYLATGNGFYASKDAGDTWDRIFGREGAVGYPEMLFLDPEDDNVLYIGGAFDAPVTWSDNGGAVPGFIVSTDAGVTWNKRMQGIAEPVFGNFEAITMHACPGGAHFYIGTSTGEIYESRDAGRNWKRVASGLPPISKGRRYRHFLTAEQKAKLEEEGKAERREQGLEDREYQSTGVVSADRG